MPIRIGSCLMAFMVASAAMPSPARSADAVKVALETFGTQGAGETLQAVISGSADIGIGIGTAGAMRAFARGAPVRVLAAAYVGVGDQYWYVPANSPLQRLTDATEKQT